MVLPAVTRMHSLSDKEIAAILDLLFEPSVTLHSLSVPDIRKNHYASYDDIISSVGSRLEELGQSGSASDMEALEGILSAHPRLGEKKIDSAQSSEEQAQLKGSQAQAEKLANLNLAYEHKFPGLRYVVFVNGRDRDTIMSDMQSRIDRGDIKLERHEAIEAMCQIAADRSRKLGWEA